MKLFFRKSGSGRPLVILHGLFGISDNWAALAKQWSEHFTVYTLDLRNHGQSPHSEEWNYAVMAEDVLEFLGDEKLNNVTLLGHSMGGKVAMRLSIDYPMAVSRLIVSDIAPRQYASQNKDVVAALLKVDLNLVHTRKDAEAILKNDLHDNGTIQFLLKNLFWKEQDSGDKRLAWRFNLDVISRKLDEVLSPTLPDTICETETLFLRGSKSPYIMEEDAIEIQQLFPNSSLITIENAGHWVHADQPAAMYEAVMNFAG